MRLVEICYLGMQGMLLLGNLIELLWSHNRWTFGFSLEAQLRSSLHERVLFLFIVAAVTSLHCYVIIQSPLVRIVSRSMCASIIASHFLIHMFAMYCYFHIVWIAVNVYGWYDLRKKMFQ